jgi:hypothetical protein
MPEESKYPPKTIQAVEEVSIKLIRYTDQNGENMSQFALVGENNVIMLDHKALGISEQRTPMGFALGWLRDGIFAMLKG